MAKPETRLNKRQLVADYLEQRDEQVMQALAAAGAFIALADGRLQDVERQELISAIRRLGLASASEAAQAFESRLRELVDGGNPEPLIEALRPVAELAITSLVLRTSARVAAADHEVHPSEVQAIDRVREILALLSDAQS
jgi:tellurite resistance protein